MTAEPLVWDPEPLTEPQRAGDACVMCSKRWPRPTVCVGVLAQPDAGALFDVAAPRRVYACDDCAPALLPS